MLVNVINIVAKRKTMFPFMLPKKSHNVALKYRKAVVVVCNMIQYDHSNCLESDINLPPITCSLLLSVSVPFDKSRPQLNYLTRIVFDFR